MIKKVYISILFLFFLSLSEWQRVLAQEPTTYTTRMLVIFDASRSMLATWGTSTRWTEAKRILTVIADSVNTMPNVESALRVYGHQTIQMENDCFDSKLEVPFAAKNAQKFKNVVTYLRPQGVTPIAYSLEQSVKDFGEVKPNQRNVIVLITDGAESCGANPCEVFRQLREKGVVMKSYVIGMGIEEEDFDQLECMGDFMNIENPSEVSDILDLTLKKVFNSTTVRVDLLDSKNKPLETDVLMTFQDSENNKVAYNFYHTINPAGQPDTLAVDPNMNYNILMHTYPPVWKKNVSLQPFVYNVVEKETPQGQLQVVVRGESFKSKINCIITQGENWVNVQNSGESVKYLLGEYKLEILTLPVITADKVKIEQNKTTIIEIPAPGSITFQKAAEIYGGVFMPDGDRWTEVYELASNNLIETLALQPGKYKVVYRFKNNKSMVTSVEKNFEVISGTSVTVKL
jgi:Ca-activated chloride channel family protein